VRRRVAVVTGTRAEFGILRPVLAAIQADKSLSLSLLATGMHLMKEFGGTLAEIKKEGFSAIKLDASYSQDTPQAHAEFVGKCQTLCAKALSKLKPDFTLVLGDRGEALAAAAASGYLRIPVGHIHGGELSGHVDGAVRHAITKLAHLHFTATEGAKKRIVRMGEEPWRVTVSGAPALDRILGEPLPTWDALARRYRLDLSRPVALVAQHPVSGEEARAGRQMEETLRALQESGVSVFAVYPNADPGGRRMISVLRKARVNARPSLPHRDFLGFLSGASVLVGNSSSGIIESASFGLPVVNVGSRQDGRERSGNVLDCAPERRAIKRAVARQLSKFRFPTDNVYGDGQAAGRIARVLATVPLGPRLLEKRMTY
jgi:GDP/UDP-N,N'-diacetylbacillosamine 2-epimerase (hydrolysing)